MKTPTKHLFTITLLCCLQQATAQLVGIGTQAPQNGNLQINGNRDRLPLVAMLDSSVFGTGSVRFTNLARLSYPITIAGLSLGTTHAQSSLTIFSPVANIAHFTGDGKVGINQIDAQTTLDVNGTTRTLGLQIEGSNFLELGRGLTKQTDAGKICYTCFGEANRLHMVGGGTNAGGTDRVIKLWTEGGLVIKGSALPDASSTYTLGRSNSIWRSSYTDTSWSNVFFLRNTTMHIKSGPAEMVFALNADNLFSVNSGGITPSADNDIYLGTPSKRFIAVYAATGTIQTSDATMKTNIGLSPYGIEEVMKMNPVQFNWKENPEGKKEIGFLAQEMEKLVPEAVVNSGEGVPLGMKYSELIPVLVKAIQSQQQRIAALEKTIETLKR